MLRHEKGSSLPAQQEYGNTEKQQGYESFSRTFSSFIDQVNLPAS